ncbi:hypothetical protein EYF80_050766 [Liparis tanakae]|uniref:Uncharacterized protein n=1 Tax=Liparis tanakae TaxID=230148 RepID=A0A4Z2FE78_9TELE|nr:hypothetical protein EYF80_050766 [Liparis tanakae]
MEMTGPGHGGQLRIKPTDTNEEHPEHFQWKRSSEPKPLTVRICTLTSVCPSPYAAHLQGEDSVVVQRGHLLPRQGVSRLVIDLKAGVELQHVQQLQQRDGTSYLREGATVALDLRVRAYDHSRCCVSGTWQKRCPSFSRWERLDRWQLTTRSSSQRGSMDFRPLRLCKRIALKDRRRLWRRRAGRPRAAARNSEAGLSAGRTDQIYRAR